MARRRTQPEPAPQHTPAEFNLAEWLLLPWLVGSVVYLYFFLFSPLGTHGIEAPRKEFVAFWWNPQIVWSLWTYNGNPITLTDRFPLLVLALSLVGLAAVLGGASLRLIGHQHPSRRRRLQFWVLAISIGLQLLSLYTLTMGLIGFLNRAMFVIPLLLLALLAAFHLWRTTATGEAELEEAEDEVPSQEDDSPNTPNWFDRLVPWLLIPLALSLVLGGLLPPSDFDVREYHLQGPKEWFQTQQIVLLEHNVYTNMPMGAEMHALLAMVVWGGVEGWWWGALAGKLIISLIPLGTSAALYDYANRHYSRRAGLIAALLYLATPWVHHISRNGLVDCVLAHYFVLAVLCLLEYQSSKAKSQRRWLLLLGILLGAAISCKYTGLLFALPCLIWLLSIDVRQRITEAAAETQHQLLARAKSGLLVLFIAGAVSSPWLTKNILQTGNPVYPLLTNVFGERIRSAELVERFDNAHRASRNDEQSRYSWEAIGESVWQILVRSPWQGPLLIPFLVLCGLRADARQRLLPLGLLAASCFLLWWLFTHRIDRFWIPVLPVLCLLAGLGSVWNATQLWRTTVPVVTLVGLFLIMPLCMFPGTMNHLLTPLEILRTRGPQLTTMHQYLNEELDASSRILLVGDAEPFDLRVPVIYNTVFNECRLETICRDATPREQRRQLNDLGVTHVCINWRELDRYRSVGNYGYSDFVTRNRVRIQMVELDGLLEKIKVPNVDTKEVELFRVKRSSEADTAD